MWFKERGTGKFLYITKAGEHWLLFDGGMYITQEVLELTREEAKLIYLL